MWDSNSDTGEKQEGWKSGLKPFRLKVFISDYIDAMAKDHMDENHSAWMYEKTGEVLIESKEPVYVYLEINPVTGELVVVGCDGHPLDKTKRIK